jgi:hypothetical protein
MFDVIDRQRGDEGSAQELRVASERCGGIERDAQGPFAARSRAGRAADPKDERSEFCRGPSLRSMFVRPHLNSICSPACAMNSSTPHEK